MSSDTISSPQEKTKTTRRRTALSQEDRLDRLGKILGVTSGKEQEHAYLRAKVQKGNSKTKNVPAKETSPSSRQLLNQLNGNLVRINCMPILF